MTILITATNWWHSPARLAVALGNAGARVAVICPRGSPVLKARAVSAHFRYSAFDPIDALAGAIALCRPDFIVPTDDRAVAHLHELHGRAARGGSTGVELRRIIELSLGEPEHFGSVRSRAEVLEIAREENILVPDGMTIEGPGDLDQWQRRHKFPWVLKNDGTCGGSGVRIVGTPDEARRAFHELGRQNRFYNAAKSFVVDRDPFPARSWFRRERPALTAQSFVAGSPANCAVACWRGKVIAGFSVAVSATENPTGSASIVRLADDPAMMRAAERLVRRLGISGFCGLDFVIESRTGAPNFIELNPRLTQLCHLQLGPGRDLAAALFARMRGVPAPVAPCVPSSDTIVIFPNAWLQGLGDEAISSGYQDVPWEEPTLVNELLKAPWHKRGLVRALLRGARSGGVPQREARNRISLARIAPRSVPRPDANTPSFQQFPPVQT